MHLHNFSSHHMVTTFRIGEWHYNCVLEGNLDDCFADPSRCGVDAQGIVDGLLGRFGAGGLAYMQRRAVGASEGGGDALVSFEDAAQRRPTGILTGLTQPCECRVRSRLTTRQPYPCSRSHWTRSSVAIPRSITTRAARGALSASSISASVWCARTLPANTWERRTKPLASSTSPRVSSGQSVRLSLECPRRALGCRGPEEPAAARRTRVRAVRACLTERWTPYQGRGGGSVATIIWCSPSTAICAL